MRWTLLASLVATLTLVACGDDDDPMDGTTTFTLRIENISDQSGLPTPLAPVIWTISNDLFTPDAMDDGMGLEMLAEDGDPSGLLASLPAGAEGGILNTAVGSSTPGPIMPGQAYEGTFTLADAAGDLTLASMVVQSNDLFLAPAAPIPLFDMGSPLAARDVTSYISLWDAGTEVNQAPGAGLDQAPRQTGPNTGAYEGVVAMFRDSTRALPGAGRIVDVSVSESGGTFELTLHNHSEAAGSLVTPVAPLFWAVHDASWSLFADGGSASLGLEELAEEGSPATLVGEHASAAGVLAAGAQTVTVERPSDPAGPAMPGERFVASVTPDTDHRYLTVAAMVVESNDAFLAFPPAGVALLDGAGNVRPAADVELDISRWLAVWDAGTEANEAPGAGPHQPLRSTPGQMQPTDPDATVRRYADSTNDLADLATLVDIEVVAGMAGSFEVTVTNNSDLGSLPTPFTPAVWAVHDDDIALFTAGESASVGIERLAEDGNVQPLADALAMASAVDSSGIDGPGGPVMPGDSFSFTVTPTTDARYLSLASMVIKSNDAFFGLADIELLDDLGAARSDMDIAADVASALAVYDAGTEGNQIGAAGSDQPLNGGQPNTGPAAGSGLVRLYNDPVWSYPEIEALVRVTVTPAP